LDIDTEFLETDITRYTALVAGNKIWEDWQICQYNWLCHLSALF